MEYRARVLETKEMRRKSPGSKTEDRRWAAGHPGQRRAWGFSRLAWAPTGPAGPPRTLEAFTEHDSQTAGLCIGLEQGPQSTYCFLTCTHAFLI